MKPVDLVVWGIKNSSKTLDIILDLKYMDVIVRRWQEMTGMQTKLTDTDQEFNEVEKDRLCKETEASQPVEGFDSLNL